MRIIFILLAFLISLPAPSPAQEAETQALPYHQIPDYPENYAPGNIMSRLIDGLGYRYYWATEGLTEEDLNYKPSPDARNTLQTITHIYELSQMVLNALLNQPNIRPSDETVLDFATLRRSTLLNLQQASTLCNGKKEDDFSDCTVTFQRGETTSEFPFWHIINGPVSDALYHTGQIVAFRRASGNPLDSGVNVFLGKNRDQ